VTVILASQPGDGILPPSLSDLALLFFFPLCAQACLHILPEIKAKTAAYYEYKADI
jgi:hypothetical protein